MKLTKKEEIPENWQNMEREDLRLAGKAIELGFYIKKRPGICEPLKFVKNNKHIWKTFALQGMVWCCAEVIDNKFQYHRAYRYLEDALKKEA